MLILIQNSVVQVTLTMVRCKMCLAIYKRKGIKIDKDLIDNIKTAWTVNSDGAGYSIKLDEGIYTKKGIMQLDELLNDLKVIGDNEAVIHLRYATSGEVDEGMTHPFNIDYKVSNKELKAVEFISNRVLAHNGVLFSPNLDDYSDTAILAKMISRLKLKRLSDILGDKALVDIFKDDRFCLMAKDEGTILIGEWHEINEVKYSNLYSLRKYSEVKWSNSWMDEEWNNEDYKQNKVKCLDCGSNEVDFVGMHDDIFTCYECGSIFSGNGFRLY
jgi:hypothetical protein